MEVHHIGYLVKKINSSIKAFEMLGYRLSGAPVWDELREAYICFLENETYCVELVQPSQGSSLYSLLKQYKDAPYHMCYRCSNLQETIIRLRENKFVLFREPAPAPAISETATVAFMMHAGGGIIELLED